MSLITNHRVLLLKCGNSKVFHLSDLSKCLTRSSRRSLSTSVAPTKRSWKNETPPGSLTELHVYHPDSDIIWPDPRLGSLFSAPDPRFPFPGLTGLAEKPVLSNNNEEKSSPNNNDKILSEPWPLTHNNKSSAAFDVLKEPLNHENQVSALYSAHDYIKYNSDHDYLIKGVLTEFPELPGMKELKCELHEAPVLLKKEIEPLFPNLPHITKGSLSVITLAQKTVNDMSVYNSEMDKERDELTEHFVNISKEICARMRDEGYWADFIDPNSGTPFYSDHTSTTMFETDEKYRLLGFRIEDLGCCKVICHQDFGRNVFVGAIFTNAHPSHGVIQDMFESLKIS